MKTLLGYSLLALLACTGLARADCVPEAQAKADSPCVVRRDHHVVLTLDEADTWSQAAVDRDALERKVTLLSQAASERQQAIMKALQAYQQQKQATEAADTRADIASERSAALEKQLTDERARADSVWRSPVLWVVLGAVVGGAVVAAVSR